MRRRQRRPQQRPDGVHQRRRAVVRLRHNAQVKRSALLHLQGIMLPETVLCLHQAVDCATLSACLLPEVGLLLTLHSG